MNFDDILPYPYIKYLPGDAFKPVLHLVISNPTMVKKYSFYIHGISYENGHGISNAI